MIKKCRPTSINENAIFSCQIPAIASGTEKIMQIKHSWRFFFPLTLLNVLKKKWGKKTNFGIAPKFFHNEPDSSSTYCSRN